MTWMTMTMTMTEETWINDLGGGLEIALPCYLVIAGSEPMSTWRRGSRLRMVADVPRRSSVTGQKVPRLSPRSVHQSGPVADRAEGHTMFA